MQLLVHIWYIYVCVPVPSLRPLVSNQLWGRKNGRKNYSWTSKIKMDTVRGWNFPSINFYRTKIVPWNSLLFAVILHIFNLFFLIYISFFLSYSVPSLHFQSSRSFRIGYFSPRKNVPGITVCNDNSETTILSIAALEKRRFLFIFSLFFRLFLFFISIDYLELVVHYFLLRNVSLLHRCVLADIYIYSTD